MSIAGVTQAGYTPGLERAAERAQPRPAEGRPQSAAAQAVVQAQPETARAEALTATPPEGVDPSLWSVLTTEERAYFAKVGSLGPLTYGPTSSPARPALRGGRVDVTV